MRDVDPPAARVSGRSRRALVAATGVLWVAAGIVGARAVLLNAGFLHDDAFITLRYAQNLLAGNGVAWNPGDRVEGYTNFLQLMVVSGLGALGLDLVTATRALAGAAYCGAFAFVALWLRRGQVDGEQGRAALLVSLPLAAGFASVPLVAWGFGGLEAPLLTACVTVGVLLMADIRSAARPAARATWGGLALSLAVMTRPDAGLFVACAGALLLWPVEGRVRWRVAFCFAAPVVVTIAPWLAWKLAYYGDVLPNTFHVKASDPSSRRLWVGLRYVGAYAALPPFALGLLAAGVFRAGLSRRLDAGVVFALAGVALHVLWVCFVGGDQMPMHRLLVPVVPLAAWLTYRLWLADLQRLADGSLAVVALALSAALALQLVVPATATRHVNSTAFVGAAVGDWIEQHWRPGALIALNTAGSTPYYAPGFRYIDMLGLNDAHIARRPSAAPRIRGQLLPGHAKGDGVYVLDQQPDYIILGPAHGALARQPWFLSDLEIAEDERFRADYVKRQTRIDVTERPRWSSFPETATGDFLFTFYVWRDSAER